MQSLEQIAAAVLDTHAWVWMSVGAPEARKAAAFRGRSIVSAISVWEVAMLVQKGRLDLAPDVDTWISTNLKRSVEIEPISPISQFLQFCRKKPLYESRYPLAATL